MRISRISALDHDREPLEFVDVPVPEPAAGQLRVRVLACGVCHTELDEIEGRTRPPRLPVTPGHQVVGRVDALGPRCTRFAVGDRIGVGWIFRSDGSTNENLSPDFVATGRDVDGGYAEFMLADERYAVAIPEALSDLEAAPLLCAGAIGYRSLRLCGLENGRPLALTGFGGSGHLVLPLARHLYPDSPVFVFARSAAQRSFALKLGADWAGDTHDVPPTAPAAIIDTTPAWEPVLAALAVLAPGGRLVINAIRKNDADRAQMADIDYDRHLWREKEIKSVANICLADIEEFLPIAADIPLKPTVEVYALENANAAVCALHAESVTGSKVIVPGGPEQARQPL